MKRMLCTSMYSGIVASAAIAQPCHPYWSRGGGDVPVSYYYNPLQVYALNYGDGGSLYAPEFQGGLGNPITFRWHGGQWTPLPMTGFPNYPGAESIRDSVVLDTGTGPQLWVLGRSFLSGASPPLIYWSAKWTGSVWQEGPSGFYSDLVRPSTVIDLGTGPQIYGIYHPAAIERDIFRWNGTSWDLIGDVAGQTVYRLIKLDDGSGPAMYAFGDFNGISGVPARGLAKWNGFTWAAAWPEPVWPHVTYAIHDDGSGPAIYFGGSVGTIPNQGVWRFDGHSMTNIGGPQHASPTAPISIDAFASFDDGFGPALFVGGNFPLVSGMPIRNITKFQNGTWHPVGSGVVGELMNLVGLNDVRGPSLFALSTAGGMTGAGGGTVSGTAQWVGCPNCYANCDLSTRAPVLNVNDFICFINKYAAKDPYANCTVDAVIDIDDFNCFLTKFATGCP